MEIETLFRIDERKLNSDGDDGSTLDETANQCACMWWVGRKLEKNQGA